MKILKLIQKYKRLSNEIKSGIKPTGIGILVEFTQEVAFLKNIEDEILQGLEQLRSNPCRDDATWWIIAAQEHPDIKYFEPITSMVASPNPCVWHEGILDILEQIPDERVIPYLQIAINHSLPNDPGKALSIRILEFLVDFNNEMAWKIIRDSLASPSDIVREEAKQLLIEYDNAK